VALVTAAQSGLGFGSPKRFVTEGAHVWIVDVDPAVEHVAAEIGATRGRPLRCPRFGGRRCRRRGRRRPHQRLDVAVANAGIGGGAPIADLEDGLYREILAVNLDGVFFTCRAAARAMREQRSGAIVTVGSVFGRDTPGGSGAYGAAKAGVVALTQALSREMAPFGVRANCVSPGHMATELYWRAIDRRAARAGSTPDRVRDEELAQVPLGRFGTGDDVAGLVAFLASPNAAYLTGQTINIDGGLQPR
jgi:NAD(P)-dependent dehydrogenase (short-subunit alcohol dehydrogenase family)